MAKQDINQAQATPQSPNPMTLAREIVNDIFDENSWHTVTGSRIAPAASPSR